MSGQRCIVLLGLGLAGCDARALVVGDSPERGSLGGGARPSEARCPDAAGERASDGECWPTRHVGRWRGLVTGSARYLHGSTELELPSGEVVLEIEPQGTGTLSFAPDRAPLACAGGASGAGTDAGLAGGDAAVIQDPEAQAASGSACSAADAGAPGVPRPGLVLDYRYTLEGLSMSGASVRERREDPRVSFSLLIAEPWRDWCNGAAVAADPAPCSCNRDGCSASTDALEVSLSLSRNGQALRGTLGSPTDEELAAGLELVRP